MKLFWRLFQNPIFDSSTPLFAELQRFNITEAQFSTSAEGGFADGTITLEGISDETVRDAVENWLMKRITATDAEGNVAYEGYVAEVNATSGYHQYSRTIDGFANRVYVDYNYARGSQIRQGRVIRNESNVATTTTQTELGIREEWIDVTDVGNMGIVMANAYGDVTLRRKLRARAVTTTVGSGAEKGENSITLSLWGYYSTLQFQKQSRRVPTATEIKTIITNALTGKSPFLSTDYNNMDTIGKTLTYNVNGEQQFVMDYITGVVNNGDTNGRRILFQIWEDRMASLKTRSTLPSYFTRSGDSRVWDASHTLIPPYLVRAGSAIVAESQDFALDSFEDVADRPYHSIIETTTYDDVNEVLTIPPPSGVEMTTERLLARVRVLARRRTF